MKTTKQILFFLSIALIFSTCGKDDEVTKVEKFDLKFEIVTNIPTKSELDGLNPVYDKTEIVDPKSDANIKAKYDHIKEYNLESVEIYISNVKKSSDVLNASNLGFKLTGKTHFITTQPIKTFPIGNGKITLRLNTDTTNLLKKMLLNKEVIKLEYTIQLTGKGSFDTKFIIKGSIKGGG